MMVLKIIKAMWSILPKHLKIAIMAIVIEILFFFVTLNNEGRLVMGTAILFLSPILIIALVLSIGEVIEDKNKETRLKE